MELEKEITEKEVLEISLKLEREGAKFYFELAQRISDQVTKDFLLLMAKEEGQHEKKFKELFAKTGSQPFGWEKKKEIRKLINTQFQTDIFPDLNEIFHQANEMEAILKSLDFAMEAESVSAEFYSLLGESCNVIETKTFLLLLEKEELDHLKHIQSLKEKYKS